MLLTSAAFNIIGVVLLQSAVWAGILASMLTSPDQEVGDRLELATKYSKAYRPPPDNGTANTISVFLMLSSLVKLDVAAQQLTLQLWYEKNWIDSRLAWLGRFDSRLDNVSSILVPVDMVWQPDVTFYDVVGVSDLTGDKTPVAISNKGAVQHKASVQVILKCQLALQLFPFDEQTCNIRLATMIQERRNLVLQLKSSSHSGGLTAYLTESNDFCFLDVQATLQDRPDYSFVEFKVRFQRRPTFYLINLILPSILLLAISALTFLLPPDCGERVSFSVTIVLSMCVFLQLTGNYTPIQSESVPLLTIYYSLAVVMTMLSLLGNVFALSCHFRHRTETRVECRVIRALFLNRFLNSTGDWRKNEPADSAMVSGLTTSADAACQTQAPPHASSSRHSRSGHSGAGDCSNEWTVAAAAADRCFFLAISGATLLLGLALILTSQVLASSMKCLPSGAQI